MLNPGDHTETIYAAAGFSVWDVPGAVALAHGLLGPGCVHMVAPKECWGRGELVDEGGRTVVLVDRRLSPTEAEFVVFHELWHWWIRELGLKLDWRTEEAICNVGASCLQAPREVYLDSLATHGLNLREIAADFGAPETSMALRYGEVTGKAAAVVFGGAAAWTRGGDADWDSERAIRVTRGEEHGWTVQRLTDRKNRVAVLQ